MLNLRAVLGGLSLCVFTLLPTDKALSQSGDATTVTPWSASSIGIWSARDCPSGQVAVVTGNRFVCTDRIANANRSDSSAMADRSSVANTLDPSAFVAPTQISGMPSCPNGSVLTYSGAGFTCTDTVSTAGSAGSISGNVSSSQISGGISGNQIFGGLSNATISASNVQGLQTSNNADCPYTGIPGVSGVSPALKHGEVYWSTIGAASYPFILYQCLNGTVVMPFYQ
jgi:hypothetical protein